MGNKQSNSDLFNKNQPRNVFSLYGPKVSSNSSPTQSLSSSAVNDSSFCDIDKDKIKLRLSRAHRNLIQKINQTRQDGFQVNKNPESIVKSINFITKYIHIAQTLNVIIFLKNAISYIYHPQYQVDASIIDETFLNYERQIFNQELNNIQNNKEIGNLELINLQNEIHTLNVQEDEDYSSQQQQALGIVEKQNQKQNQIDEDQSNQDLPEGIVRPTAYFGWITQKESIQPKQEMPVLRKENTFGELDGGGIQITNQQSFEDPDFAATPCRQTAFFGDLDRQSQLKGYYKQLAQKYQGQDEFYQDVQAMQQKEVKEEDEEDNSDEEDIIQKKNKDYKQKQLNSQNMIAYNEQQKAQLTDSDEEEDDEPVHIQIDLSGSKKKGRSQLANQNDKPIVVNINSEKLRQKEQNSTSKSPKNNLQNKGKPTWKPTSPHLVSSNGSNSDKNAIKNDAKQNEKSPIKIDSRKKSASFVIINKQEKQRDKNKSQDFQKEILNLDNKIEKLNNDIEVLDLIKKDITNVQNKIIRDMSPSYRKNQN